MGGKLVSLLFLSLGAMLVKGLLLPLHFPNPEWGNLFMWVPFWMVPRPNNDRNPRPPRMDG